MQCSKLCCEPCDRGLCEHPNPKKIKKCKHPSIGVCGEKTPRLCRICDKDEVEEIFFGNEDEEDARFIELEDCKHVIEVEGLIRWMNRSESESTDSNSNDNNRNSIQFKTCPICKTIIRRTKSLNTFIQASLKDIQQVKIKTCGDRKTNRKTQKSLFDKVEKIVGQPNSNDALGLRNIYKDIHKETKLKSDLVEPKPNQMLIELKNKFKLVEELKEIYSKFQKREKSSQSLNSKVIEQFDNRLRMAASFIRDYKNCEQQRADISVEISFLQTMCDVIVEGDDSIYFITT